MKTKLFLILLICSQSLFAQKPSKEVLDNLFIHGRAYNMPIKNGQIEFLRNKIPAKDTWDFAKLAYYKENIDSESIIYGEILMPSSNELYYSYNLFAYDYVKEKYYFVAICSYQIEDDILKMRNTFLFTEKKALFSWWNNTFEFYESDLIKDIPDKYLFFMCPPPPANN